MSEWKKVKLDDCLELITYGFTNPMPDTLSGPWKVTAKDINNGRIVYETARHTSQEAFENDLTDKSRPKKGDILLTKDGTLGRLAIVGDERVCINQSVALLRVNKNILSVPYLYYLLSTPLYQAKMLADAGGAAIKHIYITRVNQLLIPCPSYDEQCRIANILSRYDSLIENYQKQIKLLEEAAQRLYKEWFVDLHFPGHENTKIVDGVPEGWEKKKVSEIGKVITGKTPSTAKKEYYGEQIPFITIPDMHTGIYPTSSQFLSSLGANSQSGKFIPANSLMVSCIGTAGLVCITKEECQTNQQINSLVLNDNSLLYYMYNTFLSLKKHLNNIGSNGATMTNVNKSKFESIEILIPTNSISNLYNKAVEQSFRSIKTLSSQIHLLTEARDRLLPKLMNGELAV